MIFSIHAHWSKKHVLGWDQKSKNIVSFRVQRSKKDFLQKHQNLDFTPKEGPMVDDRVLLGSKKHFFQKCVCLFATSSKEHHMIEKCLWSLCNTHRPAVGSGGP
jgi:hypothetical protein